LLAFRVRNSRRNLEGGGGLRFYKERTP
jgi:hypothetical protein